MKVTKDLLFEEAVNAGIPREQIDELWDGLSAACARQRKYDPLQVAYYFGASIIVAAVTYFFTWPGIVSAAARILAMALTYGGIFGALGHHLYRVRELACRRRIAHWGRGLHDAGGGVRPRERARRGPRYQGPAMEFATVAASLIAFDFCASPS